MAINATSSNNAHIQNLDFNTDSTRDRQTPTNANGFEVNGKDINSAIQVGLAVANPAGAVGLAGAAALAAGAASGTPSAGGADYTSNMDRIQADGFRNSTYLIALQQQIQDENRQFTTVTNVIRAKHDTAKAALANIRS